jgi:hypothetical protein
MILSASAQSYSVSGRVGDTPAFPHDKHVVIEWTPPVAEEGWPQLLDASLRAAAEVARVADGAPALSAAAAQLTTNATTGPPFAAWMNALSGTRGAEPWPQMAEPADEDRVRIHIACPYWDGANRLAAVTDGLLEIAAGEIAGSPIAIDGKTWRRRLNDFWHSLPDRQMIRFHHRLTEARLPWQWEGGDETILGYGRRRRKIRGPQHDIEALIREFGASPAIYTVTGSVGKTTTVKLLTMLLNHPSRTLAFAVSGGAKVGTRQVMHGDCIGGQSAHRLLQHPEVDVAVLEVGRGGVIQQGIPYPRSSVGILLNVDNVHIGMDGIDSVKAMAEVKALTLTRAERVVLNHDDQPCREIASRFPAERLVWFSIGSTPPELDRLSRASRGAVGVGRDAGGTPVELTVWESGELRWQVPLEGVAPYQGLLGEKTLEELAAAVAACWFGPLQVELSAERLRSLRLNSGNHLFRTSIHPRGQISFVLDKANEEPSVQLLTKSVEALSKTGNFDRRIVVFTRAAAIAPEGHRRTCELLHPYFDEFVYFDRAPTYETIYALPIYAPGALPELFRAEFERLNAATGERKIIHTVSEFDGAMAFLDQSLDRASKALVVINQPSTQAGELDKEIVGFVSHFV